MLRTRTAPANCTALLGALALVGCTAAPAYDGPLPVRNQHPAQLLVQHLPPAPTGVLTAGDYTVRADAAYSSLFLTGTTPTASFQMDGEYLRIAAALRLGLGAGLELGAELPFAHTSGGFLDSFLIDYHDLFDLPDQKRSTSPKDRFSIQARSSGQAVWSVDESGAELLDVPLHLTWNLAEASRGLGLAVRAGVEAPTGDDDRGYGNGEWDSSFGVLLESHLGGIGWYGHLQHTFAGTPPSTRAAGLRFEDVTSAGLAAELPLTATLHGLVQVEYETSTLRDLPVLAVERDHLLLWVGARWRASQRWAVEVGFGEDLQALVSPDFTAWLGFTMLPVPASGGGGTP
jgi:hypothetical protein